MFKIEELSGSLIRSGKFREAIPVFYNEIHMALSNGVITKQEMISLCQDFSEILLNPSCLDDVANLARKMLSLSTRIPGYVNIIEAGEFNKNVNASREAR